MSAVGAQAGYLSSASFDKKFLNAERSQKSQNSRAFNTTSGERDMQAMAMHGSCSSYMIFHLSSHPWFLCENNKNQEKYWFNGYKNIVTFFSCLKRSVQRQNSRFGKVTILTAKGKGVLVVLCPSAKLRTSKRLAVKFLIL